jgi:hypothetical protein
LAPGAVAVQLAASVAGAVTAPGGARPESASGAVAALRGVGIGTATGQAAAAARGGAAADRAARGWGRANG